MSNWRLIILGEGPEEENLKKLAKGKVEFLEFQDPTEYYAKSKIFLLPSRYEGFGNVLVEAMQYGCVPISFDCDYGPSDIIENKKNGLLIENQNIEKFIEELNLLIKDEKRIKSLSKEAENNKMFSTENHVDSFISLLSSL